MLIMNEIRLFFIKKLKTIKHVETIPSDILDDFYKFILPEKCYGIEK